MSCLAMFSKKEFPVVSNLRFINRKKIHAQLSFLTSGPGLSVRLLRVNTTRHLYG